MTFDVDALRSREFSWAQRGDAIYLNAASTGPLPQCAVDELTRWANLRSTMHLLNEELQFTTLKRSRELCAALIGASPEEIALAMNTGYGVNLAARALPLSPGDVILTPDLEFPANIYPWMGAATARGFEYRRLPLPDGVLDEDALLHALDDPAVKCVSVSWVGFMTGYRVDLERVGRACKERSIYFVVDAIQGLGAYRLDVRAAHIDILACGGQKWLLSPWGTGFVYVREELARAGTTNRQLDGAKGDRRFPTNAPVRHHVARRRAKVRAGDPAVPGLCRHEREPGALERDRCGRGLGACHEPRG